MENIVLEGCVRYILIGLINEEPEVLQEYEVIIENICRGAFGQTLVSQKIPFWKDRPLLIEQLKTILDKQHVTRIENSVQS